MRQPLFLIYPSCPEEQILVVICPFIAHAVGFDHYHQIIVKFSHIVIHVSFFTAGFHDQFGARIFFSAKRYFNNIILCSYNSVFCQVADIEFRIIIQITLKYLR